MNPKEGGRRAKDLASTASQAAGQAAQKANKHPALQAMARVGFVVMGMLHIVIGWIAFRIAAPTSTAPTSSAHEASNTGALAMIAQAPGGRALLWVAVVALVALALWRLTEVFVGAKASQRAKGAALAVVFLSLALTTGKFASGGGASDEETATSTTATLLSYSWGAAVVVLAGLVVLGVGVYNVWKGATRGFVKDLEHGSSSGHVGAAITVAGVAGYVARGIAFAIAGVLVVIAGLQSDPEQAGGLDVALRTLGEQRLGSVVLCAVGAGLALYGLYSIARARYVQM
ncbi:DUF1206 domain-containing protein [Corynebacterium sp. 153RC1]|uniref:DUF1206 domain-containing protein n=1 Tax=unclassified Corynebacterium TaxID=2624378 RepID=UPI00211C1632|nr:MULTISPECIES: DUF1206 domain-containing protein [unclassified Corynebacterium]MCQ9352297.1 DUF1206 domain-containing protein [Corynebacterium sp. 209RC1]MCQ9354313.1 DUF1206 domain-containing protein [Corynebacterium sp. 1222RC1]MCQ9356595.1 DUF1206 domain-containing protein [Corynebacterium sp. 122RC1]MCQ9359605.1 DUF1206 domain-containing protein [Corynebacterium sp. 142RC1]MCQ9360547.1 DUF1206 domain-containing protein [Corynebacterium sp. 153RC1]